MTICYLSYNWLLLLLIDMLIGWIAASIAARVLLRRMAQNGGREIITPVLHNLAGGLDLSGDLAAKIADPQMLSAVKPIIEEHINTFLTVKLQEKLPVIAMFASPEMIGKIKEGMLEEIDLLLPQVLTRYLQNTGSVQNVASLLEESLRKVPPDKMQATLKSALKQELHFFKVSGAVLGLLIGIIHLLAVALYNT